MKWMKSFAMEKDRVSGSGISDFLGHKNIGYIGQCHSEDRYNGYLETLKKHDLDVIPEYVIETKQTEAEGYEAMENSSSRTTRQPESIAPMIFRR